MRTRLDALTWRLREASDDLERTRQEATNAAHVLQDTRVAHLLGEESPATLELICAQSEQAHLKLESEETLVRTLEERRAETQRDYQRALRREWMRGLIERWQTMGETGSGQ